MKACWAILSSVWVGLFLLLNLAGLATFITLRYPEPEPYFLHPLYLGLLAAFGVNILCVLTDRYRFRTEQAGFLLTHMGIVTVLAGGALTHWCGEDGQMRIPEGGATDRFTVERAGGLHRARELRVATADGGRDTRAFDAAPPARLPRYEVGDLRVEVLGHLPKAEQYREALPSPGASPLLRFRLGMAVASVEDWLQADDPVMGELEVGNRLKVRYRRLSGGLDEAAIRETFEQEIKALL